MDSKRIEVITYMVKQLKNDGVTVEEITDEINYRDNANVYETEDDRNDSKNIGDWENRWNDNLFEYSMAELEDIEELWCEVA